MIHRSKDFLKHLRLGPNIRREMEHGEDRKTPSTIIRGNQWSKASDKLKQGQRVGFTLENWHVLYVATYINGAIQSSYTRMLAAKEKNKHHVDILCFSWPGLKDREGWKGAQFIIYEYCFSLCQLAASVLIHKAENHCTIAGFHGKL